MTKKITLTLVTSVAAFVFWWKVGPWINDPLRFSDFGIWLWPVILFILLTALLGLSFLLLPKKFKLVVVLLNFLAFLLFFGIGEILLLSVAISFLFQWAALSAVQNESGNRLQFKFKSVLKTGISRLITSLLILVSFAE